MDRHPGVDPDGRRPELRDVVREQAAKAGVGAISVLNSSNRRPLRGGFWVVYTGPYTSLTQVSSAADNVHKSGFTSAYIRELIVYKAKPAAKHKNKKK